MNFLAIDFETANYSKDSACSIGLVKFQDGEPAGSYSSLIRPPELYILSKFTDIHGLTVDDVKDAPNFKDIWDSAVKPFIGDCILAAHNASFDMGILKATLEHYRLKVPKYSYFCTCNLARRTWPNLKSHKLTALAQNFNITYNAHEALDDALTCGKIVIKSAEKLGCTSVKELLSNARLEMGVLK